MPRLDIEDHYLQAKPAGGHRPDCKRAGTAQFEVHTINLFGDEAVVRLICRDCGRVVLLNGARLGFEGTDVEDIGYGTKPRRIGDVWLHAGPLSGMRGEDEHGPEKYYVSESSTPPAVRDDVLGIVAWYRTKRGAVRWCAGYRLGEHGGVSQGGPDDLTSRTAAARWVGEQRRAELRTQAAEKTAARS